VPTPFPGRRALAWLMRAQQTGSSRYGIGIESLAGVVVVLLIEPFLHFDQFYLLLVVVSFSGLTQTKAFQTRLGGPQRDRNVSLRVALTLAGSLGSIYVSGAAPLFNSAAIAAVALQMRWSGSDVYRPALFWTCLWTAIGQLTIALEWITPYWNSFTSMQLQGLAVLETLMTLVVVRLMCESKRGQERAEAGLKHSEERHRTLVQSAGDAVAVIDRTGDFTYISPAVSKVMGFTRAEIVGTSSVRYVHPDDLEIAARVARTIYAEPDQEVRCEMRIHHKDGSWRWIEITLRNLMDNPAVNGLVANYRDITERRHLQERLSHLAFHDPLTKLANRALYHERLLRALDSHLTRIAATPDTDAVTGVQMASCAVVLIDLDEFKMINDSLGHNAGDILLAQVAQSLEKVVRPQDTLARLGGDEFAMVIDQPVDDTVLTAVGRRIIQALDQPYEHNGKRFPVRASVGLAGAYADVTTAEELTRRADIALYAAKHAGKNCFTVYEPGMRLVISDRLALRTALAQAIELGQLSVHYQPAVDLRTGAWVSVETLLRWRHPERGWVSPAEIVPVAAESGLLDLIGAWVLREACSQVMRWRTLTPDLSVSVNMGTGQLLEPDFVALVQQTLRDTGLPASHLIIEVSAPVSLNDQALLTRMHELRGLGLHLALDDSASAAACLGSLHRLPLGAVKIDRAFTSQIVVSDHVRAVLAAVTQLCRALKVDVVAEGVESIEQERQLKEIGCHYVQGARYAPAAPSEEIDLLLERQAGRQESSVRPQ
jgi:diguanylate cyclase (GGDEF)-like protein/PAS domain S-box-containing protein